MGTVRRKFRCKRIRFESAFLVQCFWGITNFLHSSFLHIALHYSFDFDDVKKYVTYLRLYVMSTMLTESLFFKLEVLNDRVARD